MSTLALPANPGEIANPFKFLDYFQETDQDCFAGRERDIQDALSRVTKSRTFVLYGRSGLGKTSLIRAGLIPRLRERGYRPIYLRILSSPLEDLYAAVAEELGVPAGQSLSELVRQLTDEASRSRTTIVLICDQFEEFFIRSREARSMSGTFGETANAAVGHAARREFIDAIGQLVANVALDIRIVFSLREDYLAELAEFARVIPKVLDNDQRLLPLSAFGAREAILRPLQRSGIAYSTALTARLVDEVGAFGFDPTLLQVICWEVFRQACRRDSERVTMTEADLDELGGLEGVFRRYLDNVTDKLSSSQVLVARVLLDRLITGEKTKSAMSFRDLEAGGFRATPDEILGVLGVLETGRLIRRELRGEDHWYELLHDRLVQFVREWLDRDPAFVNFRAACDMVVHSSRGSAWRTNPVTLLNLGSVVRPYRDRLQLDTDQIEYLFRSELFHCSQDAAFWAQKLGFDAATPILLAYLADSDRSLRYGAARVAGDFPDPEGRIADACRERVSDPDADVRHSAGRSWARLQAQAPGRKWIRTRRATSQPETKPNAGLGWLRFAPTLMTLLLRLRGIPASYRAVRKETEFLAAALSEGSPLQGVPFWQRSWARRIADSQAIRRYRDEISALLMRGAAYGFLAGLGWAFSAGALLLILLGHLNDVLVEGYIVWVVFIFTPLLAAVFGAGIGWLTAVSSARETAIRGTIFSPWRLGRSRRLLMLIGAGLQLATLGYLTGETTMSLLVTCLSLPLLASRYFPVNMIWCVGFEVSATLIMRCVRGAGSKQIWAWTFLGCIGIPGATFLANGTLVGAIDIAEALARRFIIGSVAQVQDVFLFNCWPFLLTMTLVASYLVAVITNVRYFARLRVRESAEPVESAESAESAEPDSPRWPSTRISRWLTLGTIAVTVSLFLVNWGIDSFPWFARRYVMPENGPLLIKSSTGPATPDRTYVKLHLPRAMWLTVSPAQKLKTGESLAFVYQQDVRFHNSMNETTLYPSGDYLLTLSTTIFAESRAFGDSDVKLVPANVLRPADDGAIQWDGVSTAICEFTWKRPIDAGQLQQSTWHAELRVAMPPPKNGETELPITILSYPVPIAPQAVSGIVMPDGLDSPPKQAEALLLRPSQPLVLEYQSYGDGKTLKTTPVSVRVSADGSWAISLDVRSLENDPLSSGCVLYARLAPDSLRSSTPTASAAPASDTPESAIDRADELERSGGVTKASIVVLRDAIARHPDSAALHARLADSYRKTGDLNAAIMSGNEAVRWQPDNAKYLNNLAWDLCLAGRFQEALPHARLAVQLKSSRDRDTIDTLAHAEYGAGNWKEAVAAWSQLGAKYWNNPPTLHCLLDGEHFEDAQRKLQALEKPPEKPPEKTGTE